MSLLAQAAADLKTILEDADSGFGLAMTVTDPSGTSATITGFAADIGQEIDPETNQLIAGQRVHATLPMAALQAAFGAQPRAISSESAKPWIVELQLPAMAAPKTYKVIEPMPDKLGAVVCLLEIYEP